MDAFEEWWKDNGLAVSKIPMKKNVARKAFLAAMQVEREACAQVALNIHKTYSAGRAESDQAAIARMIRARGQ